MASLATRSPRVSSVGVMPVMTSIDPFARSHPVPARNPPTTG
jgi:hypothetical protein